MKIVQDDEQEVQNVEFDPTKKYSWSPESEFTLTGNEFGLIINALRATVSIQEAHAQTAILITEASIALEKALGKAFDDGTVVEITE